ncbi:MAG: BMP family ABC transporter substrate-binding protein [Veillonellaceae bacterium]|nr:BMP family ABC transporter substrate-binding protein [Veillonellaceae bacterium]
MKREKILWLLSGVMVVVFAAMLLAGCGGAKNAEKPAAKPEAAKSALRVAMVLTGPINDAGWNESAYKGLMAAKDKFKVNVAYTENVPQPDFESVIRDYADKGYNLVILHGFEFSDVVKAISPQYPKVTFAVVNGNGFQEPNMLSLRFNTPQTGFLAGAMAGLLTQTNTVGMIGGTKLPHIQDGLKGFEAGAKYVNPKVKVLTGFTETMSDVAKGKEMAMAMIEQGADVVSGNANQASLGIIDAAKTKKIKAIGYISDQYNVAPDTVFVSAVQSVTFMIETIIGKAVKNEAKPALYLMGVNESAIFLSDFHGNDSKLPAGAAEKLKDVVAKIKDGSLKKQGVLPKSIFEK